MSPTPRFFPGLRDWYNTVNADRYVQEAVRNTLGNEEKNFQQQMSKIKEFQKNFRDKLIAANPKILREHRLMQISRRRPSQAYSQFMKEATTRSNTAVRKQFKNVLPKLDKYQARKVKYINSLQDKYAATNPRYARFLANDRARDKTRKQAALKQNQQWEKWAKQNDPNVYKQYLRHKKKYGGDPSINSVSRAFYNQPQDVGMHESQNRWRQSQGQQPTPRWPTLITDNIRTDQIPRQYKPLLNIIEPSKIQNLFDRQADFNAQQAQFREQYIRQQREAAEAANKQWQDSINKRPEAPIVAPKPKQPKPKVGPITRTTTHTQPKAKIGTVVDERTKPVQRIMHTPSKGPTKKPKWANTASPNWKKSGGKVTKTYANGGGVRKPKYNKKG